MHCSLPVSGISTENVMHIYVSSIIHIHIIHCNYHPQQAVALREDAVVYEVWRTKPGCFQR